METRQQDEELALAVRDAARQLNKRIMDAADNGLSVEIRAHPLAGKTGRPYVEKVAVAIMRTL